MPNYYIDGTTLANSTAVYTDQALTTCAPQGYYSDGTISRYLVSTATECYLQAPQECTSCASPCGEPIEASGVDGIYKIELDVGSTPSDVGAMIVQFNPYAVPDGVLVEYNSIVYNKGVRFAGATDPLLTGGTGFQNAGGLAQSQNANNYTVVGTNSGACGTSGTDLIGSGNLTVYNYVNGAFVNSGTTEAYNIALDDCVVQLSQPPQIGNFVLVIPKTAATPSLLTVKAIGPCSTTQFDIAVDCPIQLSPFTSNLTPVASSGLACNETLSDSLYAVGTADFPNAAPTTAPEIRDQVFEDANGATPVSDGWRAYMSGIDKITYQTLDGVVVDKLVCVS